MAFKQLYWAGSTLDDVRGFPPDARREIGHQLHLVQLGLMANDWKPMASIGAGVYEIRIHCEGEYRVLYVAKFTEGVYVLHAFHKKRQRTRRADLDIARVRLRDVQQARQDSRRRKE